MKKGFTKEEIKVLESMISEIHSSMDKLIEHIRDKGIEAEEWADERSEAWHESERSDEFNDWISELDYAADTLEGARDEITIEELDDIL